MKAKPVTGRITIRELTSVADPALRQAHSLLKKNFERNELVGLHEWISSLEEKSDRVLTDIAWHLFVAEQDGKVVGLASGTYIGNVNVGMVGYLVISSGERARGTGNRLRTRLRAQFEKDALAIAGRKLAGIIGEVSDGNPWLKTLTRRPAIIVLDFEYFQPHLNPGDTPSSFFLYFESVNRKKPRVAGADLRRILYAIWRRVYRVRRPLDSPEFRSMLKSIGRRRIVGARQLSFDNKT